MINNPDHYISICKENVFGKNGRFYLMGIAMTWIFIFHFYCWYQGTRPWWIYFFSEGQTGVDIFLFLSAYGLEASYRKNSCWRFCKNRIIRILPSCSLFLFILFVFFQNDIPLIRVALQCLGQLTGLSLFQDKSFFSTDFSFDWYTPAIIILYAFYPFISYILNTITKKRIAIELVFLILLILFSILSLRITHLPVRWLLYRIPIIVLGGVSYIHLKDNNLNRLLYLYIVAFIGGWLSNQHWILSSLIVPVFLTVFSMLRIHYPFYNFFCVIGRHSYEIYLAHIFPVTNFLKLYVFENFYIYILITVLWTIVITTIFCIFQNRCKLIFDKFEPPSKI